MVSIFYHRDHEIILQVRRGTGIYLLILYGLGIFQVLLDAQSLKKLENLPNFDLYFNL